MVILKVPLEISAVMHLVRMESVLLMAQQVVLNVEVSIMIMEKQVDA